MYKEKEFFEKIKDRFGISYMRTIKSLVEDVNEANTNGELPEGVELYIDYNDVHGDGEYDTYGTFMARMLTDGKDVGAALVDNLNVEDLDNVMCGIESAFEEIKSWRNEKGSKAAANNDMLADKLCDDRKNAILTFFVGKDLKREKLVDFTKRPLDEQFFVLGKTEKTILEEKNKSISALDQYFVNEYALTTLVRHYHDRCLELEAEVASLQDKLLVTKI